MRIARTDIRRAIGEPAFSRGHDYFVRGKVLAVTVDDAGLINGEISGSGRRRYQATARVAFTPSGTLGSVRGHCTCPVGVNCKHVAALLLAAGETGAAAAAPAAAAALPHQARPVAPAPARLPGAVQVWLDRWRESYGDAEAAQQASRSTGDRLFYVFRRDERGEAAIVPFKAYVRKDGGVGTNAKEYSGYNVSNLPAFATSVDAGLLARLGYFSAKTWPRRYNWPEGEALRAFLQEVVATGRARALDIRGPALAWAPSRQVSLAWEATETGDQRIVAREDATGDALDLLPFPEPVYLDAAAGEIGFAETGLPPMTAARLASAPPIPAEAAEPVAEAIRELNAAIPSPRLVQVEERVGVAPEPRLTLFGHERKQRMPSRYWFREPAEPATRIYPCGRISIAYAGAEEVHRPGEGPDIRMVENGGVVVIRRDLARETQFAGNLETIAEPYEGLHPDLIEFGGTPPKPVREAHVVFPPIVPEECHIDALALAFTAEAVPELRAEGWQVDIDPSWPFRIYDGPVNYSAGFEASGTEWFSLALTLEAGGQTLDLTAIVLQIIAVLPVDELGDLEAGFDVEEFLSEQVFYPVLPDGAHVPIAGEQLAGFVTAFLEAQGLVGFHRAEAGRAAALAGALEGCGVAWSGGREILELGQRLQRLKQTQDSLPPPGLTAELRPYQRTGYGWLRALSDTGFGGALADDMGLGKTVQALALLAHRHLEAGCDRPSLLVAPTSLLGNWRREAARFTPDLKLLVLHGPDRRARFAEIPKHHLIVTTYPLVNRDHADIFVHSYDLAILDEAQAVKNPAAAMAKRIREIDARMRLALTGTPMENNLQELWALYDWLIPGLLWDRKEFAAKYRRPIEQQGDRARQRELSIRLKPFLLRRTKEEVASDLPPKTVIDEFIALESGQAALYESIRTAMDVRVREAIASRGLAASRITILDALLKLRQACGDPGLVKLAAARKVTESAKRARLLELLEELVAEGRKVLVFSQFVEMLRLIEADLATRGWDYALLHGQTRDRDAEIEKFHSGQTNLFLISLKAGGVGLNLTAADTVILYDPWWNPAVERQAMDRAHRIGQDKPVFVYRLIAENTVETAIQNMQARKQALADALFEGAGDGPLALTEEDLVQLFGAG